VTSELPSPDLLRRFREKHQITRSSAAVALGVSHVTILEWEERKKFPSGHHKRAIAIWTSNFVPEDGWPLSAKEQELEDKVEKIRPFEGQPDTDRDTTPDSPRGAQ
jgi:transcriptional regulator with XRE-family HTH domain